MKKIILTLFCLLFSTFAVAFDCSKVKPFVPNGKQSADVVITRFFWSPQGGDEVQQEENICTAQVTVYSYDIRGRETDAFWCLKPKPEEIATCGAIFDGAKSQFVVIPSIWTRTVKSDLRDYQFHASLFTLGEQGMFKHDVFARSQLSKLSPAKVGLDGAFRDGLPNYHDGYEASVSFK